MPIDLLYFANPMCSWCWGFAPVVREIIAMGPDSRLTVATGTLGADRASLPMREKDKAYVRKHWQHVVERTGQTFDFTFFEREGFVYDTEPACRALAVVRRHYPALAASFLHRLHETFYAGNRDITAVSLLAELAGEFGIDSNLFLANMEEPALRQEVASEWEQTARLGVTGYPTLLALRDRRAHVITVGYRTMEEIGPTLDQLQSAG